MATYDSGVLIGRFQPLHKGHEHLIETGLKLCDRLFIIVGSSQESGTLRNPFNVSTRIKLIEEVYGDFNKVRVIALTDMTNEGDVTPLWGQYVLDNIEKFLYKQPELMIYGNESLRNSWFNENDLRNCGLLALPRTDVPISATLLREIMVKDDRKQWMNWVNPKLHKHYDWLRGELMAVPAYKEMFNSMLKIS